MSPAGSNVLPMNTTRIRLYAGIGTMTAGVLWSLAAPALDVFGYHGWENGHLTVERGRVQASEPHRWHHWCGRNPSLGFGDPAETPDRNAPYGTYGNCLRWKGESR